MKRDMHLGDPCVFCDQPWDKIEPGPCPGRPGLEEIADLQLTVSALQDRYLRLHERCTQHEIVREAANRLHLALLNAYSPDPNEMCDWLDDLCAYEMIQLEDALTAFEEMAEEQNG